MEDFAFHIFSFIVIVSVLFNCKRKRFNFFDTINYKYVVSDDRFYNIFFNIFLIFVLLFYPLSAISYYLFSANGILIPSILFPFYFYFLTKYYAKKYRLIEKVRK